MGGCCALVAGTLRMVNDLADFVAGVLADTKKTRKRDVTPQRVLLAAQLMPLQRESGLELTVKGEQVVPAIMSTSVC